MDDHDPLGWMTPHSVMGDIPLLDDPRILDEVPAAVTVGGGGGSGGAHPKKLKCFFMISLNTTSDIIRQIWLITRTKNTAARLK